MASMTLAEFRDTLTYQLGAMNDQLNNLGLDTIPPQLIEAQVNLETGGTFDPELRHPGGAIGLGQIMPNGYEFGAYRQEVDPNIEASDLTNPVVNLNVMTYGMAKRKASGETERKAGGIGAYADWFMAAAGYLGGANNAGFNTAADSNGTTGELYVRTLEKYIRRVWGNDAADDIDDLGEGAVLVSGGDWSDDDAAITYDPSAPGVDRKGEVAALTRLFDSYGDGSLDSQDEGRDTSLQGQVAAGIAAALGPLLDYAPRVGLALGGTALAIVGILVLARGKIAHGLTQGLAG